MSRAHPKPPRSLIMDIVATVAAERRVSPDDICGLGRTAAIARARHEVWRRLNRLEWSVTSIARAWGCNSATVHTVISPTPSKLARSALKLKRSAFGTEILAAWPAIDAKLAERSQ